MPATPSAIADIKECEKIASPALAKAMKAHGFTFEKAFYPGDRLKLELQSPDYYFEHHFVRHDSDASKRLAFKATRHEVTSDTPLKFEITLEYWISKNGKHYHVPVPEFLPEDLINDTALQTKRYGSPSLVPPMPQLIADAMIQVMESQYVPLFSMDTDTLIKKSKYYTWLAILIILLSLGIAAFIFMSPDATITIN